MNGALYWLAVGSFKVGAFLDVDGKPQLGTSGHFEPGSTEDVVKAMRAVRLCILYPDNIEEELRKTGLLHYRMIGR